MAQSLLMKSIESMQHDQAHRQLELLLFRLDGPQLYGMNIFKVREIIPTPAIAPVPKAAPQIVGIADIRGENLVVIDLAQCIGLTPLRHNPHTKTLVSEFSHHRQGFLVEQVEQIAYLSWENVTPPPETLSSSPYLPAITHFENELVEIIDIEKVMADLTQENMAVPGMLADMAADAAFKPEDYFVLAVDDSRVAREHLRKVLSELGVRFQLANNGKEALTFLKKWAKDAEDGMAEPVHKRVLMVLSDVKMPEMDGYTLTQEIRQDQRLKNLHVVLNSSLTGQANEDFAKKVGADQFFTKWNVENIAQLIFDYIKQQHLSLR